MQTLRNIIVVGGGAAGWLTASLLAADHLHDKSVQVTLVESPHVPMLGVGEGTWPTMRQTLSRIGLSETDFIRRCQASFKQASCFINWTDGSKDDRYYHPFMLPEGDGDCNMPFWWQTGPSTHVDFANFVSPQPAICDHFLAPKQISTPEYGAVANYGYHLDAGAFAVMLQEHGTENLGIRHILDHVVGVETHENGDVRSITLKEQPEVAGDLFVDCTGSRALLIGDHYGIPLLDQRHILFNDTALAMQVPYKNPDDPIQSATLSTAQEAGWIWDIGLQNRRGIGYVYSSRHTEDDRAEAVLRAYVADLVGQDIAAELSTRKIGFNPGYREKFWVRNCVAVGMSAGFLEPLEASQLVMIELAAGMISEQLPESRALMDIAAKRFNERFTYRWERIIDFLKLHYILSKRRDTAYWQEITSTETVSEKLKDQLSLWQHTIPSTYDFYQAQEVFGPASYHYVLYGMGFEKATRLKPFSSDSPEKVKGYAEKNAKMTQKYVTGLPTNRQLLQHVLEKGMPRL